MNVDEIIKKINHKIERDSRRVEEYRAREKKGNLSTSGHWSKGYYEGYVSALNSILFLIEKEQGVLGSEEVINKEEEENGNTKRVI